MNEDIPVSVCCGEEMADYPDRDICPRCGEHTGVETLTEDEEMFNGMKESGEKELSAVTILNMLYRSEINIHISTLWDGRYDVKLGDSMNGYQAEDNVETFLDCIEFLDREAQVHFPKSMFTRWSNGESVEDIIADNVARQKEA